LNIVIGLSACDVTSCSNALGDRFCLIRKCATGEVGGFTQGEKTEWFMSELEIEDLGWNLVGHFSPPLHQLA